MTAMLQTAVDFFRERKISHLIQILLEFDRRGAIGTGNGLSLSRRQTIT